MSKTSTLKSIIRAYKYGAGNTGTVSPTYTYTHTSGRTGAQKVKKAYVGDAQGLARLFFTGLDPVFANNTWADIIAACQSGAVPDTWAVGDSKSMTINGDNYKFDIIGKNHDTYTTGGKAPLTFQLHHCNIAKYQMNSSDTNSGGYTSSEMHTTHLPKILNSMPIEVQSAIKQVNKQTAAGSFMTSIDTMACKLFLLSEIEVFGSTIFSSAGEGNQYAYYAAGNSTVKQFSGGAGQWWLRGPRSGTSNIFCYVYTTGESNGDGFASNTKCVSFAFCF